MTQTRRRAGGDEPKAATLEELSAQPRAEKPLVITLANGDKRTLRLRALPGDQYDDLEGKHPPDLKRDVDNYGQPLRFNVRTFAPALVAACLAEPVATDSEVRAFWKDWSKADREALYLAAFYLNERTDRLGEALPVVAPTLDDDDSAPGAPTTG